MESDACLVFCCSRSFRFCRLDFDLFSCDGVECKNEVEGAFEKMLACSKSEYWCVISLLSLSADHRWPEQVRMCLRVLKSLLDRHPVLWSAFSRLHLGTFYFGSAFLHISKRIAGIEYVEWRGESSSISVSFTILPLFFVHAEATFPAA